MKLGHQLFCQLGIATADRLELYLAKAADSDRSGGGIGEIDYAVFGHGAAIIDADEDGFVISEIRDPDPASEGEAAVGAGESVHIEGFAVGGCLALKVASIPGGDADLEPVAGFCFVRGRFGGCVGLCRRSSILDRRSRIACGCRGTQSKRQSYDGNSASHHSDLAIAYFGRNHLHVLAPVTIVLS